MNNTVNAPEMAGTYTIVVNNNLEIVSVTHKGQLLKNRSLDPTDTEYIAPNDTKFKPQHFDEIPNSDEVMVPPELKLGCVGFGAIGPDPDGKDPCRWLWGTWW